jgi:hypothetical protein
MNANHKDSIRVKSIPDDVDLARTLMSPALLPASAVPGAFSSTVLCPALAGAPHAVTLLRARRERPRGSRAAEQGDELAAFQLIELHLIPASEGRTVGYRIGKDQSADILNLVSRRRPPPRRDITGDGLRKMLPARGLPWCRSCAGLRRRDRSPAL